VTDVVVVLVVAVVDVDVVVVVVSGTCVTTVRFGGMSEPGPLIAIVIVPKLQGTRAIP
jgi:hypothetical protein